ncbi:MAG: hypothetical protein PHF57_02495 [Methanoregula sp.]|nr:hypothetical protein [Methanoregula sp.]MDD5187057.1 hypothetical protein [Methanoregula sp.]
MEFVVFASPEKHIYPRGVKKFQMPTDSGILYNLALFKQRYTRGTSWTQIVLNFGIITANAKLFEDFFWIHFGLTLPMVIALSVPASASVISSDILMRGVDSGRWRTT